MKLNLTELRGSVWSVLHIRKRIGESGAEMIFQASVAMHGRSGRERVTVSDTTVQGNNITYPTDASWHKS